MQFAAYAQVVYKFIQTIQHYLPEKLPQASSFLLLHLLLRVFVRYTKSGN